MGAPRPYMGKDCCCWKLPAPCIPPDWGRSMAETEWRMRMTPGGASNPLGMAPYGMEEAAYDEDGGIMYAPWQNIPLFGARGLSLHAG